MSLFDLSDLIISSQGPHGGRLDVDEIKCVKGQLWRRVRDKGALILVWCSDVDNTRDEK